MMYLYELKTGFIGESYERCYAWAKDAAEAKSLFSARYPEKPVPSVEPLFSSDCGPFLTELSDDGWDVL